MKFSWTSGQMAHLMLRLALGISILMHGLVRIPKLQTFALGMMESYASTFIAGWPALAAGYGIPIVEVVAGALILIGSRFVKWGCFIGGLLMGVIMFGAALLENWGVMPSALIHLLVFYFLMISKYTQE